MVAPQAKAAAVVVPLINPTHSKHRLPYFSSSGISIIVPLFNEASNPAAAKALRGWLEHLVSCGKPGDELILIDGDSQDLTASVINAFVLDCQSLKEIPSVLSLCSDQGRAKQMNAGALLASNEWLWFLHGDSNLNTAHIEHIRSLGEKSVWGRFDVRLSSQRWPYRVIEWFINRRSRLTQVMTGDQGIFVRRDVLKTQGGYKVMPLMEDVELSKRLRLIASAECSGPVLITSARRWEKHGIVRTVILMWKLRLLYCIGHDPASLVKQYYR